MRFTGVVVATRVLNPVDFGAFAQALLLMGVPCTLRDLGISNALIAYDGTDRSYPRFHFQIIVCSSLVCAGLIFATSSLWTKFSSDVLATAPWLALLVIIEGLGITGVIAAQKSFRFKALAGVEICAVAGSLAVIILGAGRVNGLSLLLGARFTESLIRTGSVGILETWKHVGLVRNLEILRYYAGFARYGAPQALVENAIAQLDSFLLSTFSTVYQLGLYDRILQFSRIPLSLSINLIDKVALVSFSQHQHETQRLQQLLRIFAGISLGAATVVVLVVTFALPAVVTQMLGEEWMHRLLPLWWAALPLMLLRPLSWCLSIFMQGVGNIPALFRFMVFGLCATALGGIAFVPAFGAIGMLTALAFAHILLVTYQLLVIRGWFRSRIPAQPASADLPIR